MGNAHLNPREMLEGSPKAAEAGICNALEMRKVAAATGARRKGVPDLAAARGSGRPDRPLPQAGKRRPLIPQGMGGGAQPITPPAVAPVCLGCRQ